MNINYFPLQKRFGLEYFPILVAKVVWRRLKWLRLKNLGKHTFGAPEYLAEMDGQKLTYKSKILRNSTLPSGNRDWKFSGG